MGNAEQFIDQSDALALEINKLGLNWTMVPRKKWHDYSEVDAVVAVRPRELGILHGRDAEAFSRNRKPATKLYNAWLAGVPAILSPDVAFQDIRESELDFLEARDVPEILERINRLMKNPALRTSMVENGRRRANEFESAKTVQKWIEIFEHQIFPQYVRWSRSPSRRWWFFRSRTFGARWRGHYDWVTVRAGSFARNLLSRMQGS
jgi:hypothetical protein